MAIELREVNQEELRELAGHGEGRVLSVFLRLDLPQTPSGRVRETELESRLTEAERKLHAELGDGADVDSLVGRVRKALDGVSLEDPTIHGLAVICPEQGEPIAYALRRQPPFDVALSFRDGPALEPLVEALPGLAWGIALVNRHHGRVFRGSELGLAEVADVEDDVHRWHSQGGWSQARFQRGIEKETKDHVRHVCERLFAMHQRRPFDRVAVLAPPELWPLVEEGLHPYLHERLAGHVAVDVEEAGAEEVLSRTADLMAGEREKRVRQALARLQQDLGTHERAAAGFEQVQQAIGEGRVELLLVEEGETEEPVERAVEGALAQAAEVLVVEPGALEGAQRIAALLRY
jgi:peptide chain release factor subunit 1